jgi:hypothetical protein
MSAVSFKLLSNFGSLDMPFNCYPPQTIQMQKKSDNICLWIQISIRNVGTLKGQVFCTSAVYFYFMSLWIEVEIFLLFLLFSSTFIMTGDRK